MKNDCEFLLAFSVERIILEKDMKSAAYWLATLKVMPWVAMHTVFW